MRVSLINIRGRHTFSPGVPLGIAYLGGALRRDKHKVQLVDPLSLPLNKAIRQIVKFKPDLVGISTMTLNFRMAMEATKQLRQSLGKKIILCAGGLHPTAMPQQALLKLGADFVVVGEGEETLSSVCRAFNSKKDFKRIPGVGFLNPKGNFILNPQKIIENLDSLPFPAFELLDMNLYLRPPGFIRGMVFNRVATVMFSRGCPFRCTYCSSSVMFKRRPRFHSPQYITTLLWHLKTVYDIDAYYFTDETFTLDRQRIFNLGAKIKDLGLPWGCSTRADLLDDEMLKTMRDSGCVHIDFGLESGSQRIRNLLHRGQTQKTFEKTFSSCKKLGIRQFAQIMVGCPTETFAEVKKTAKMLKKLKPTYTMVSIFTPLPGTEAFESLKEKLEPIDEYIERLYDFDIANTDYPLVNVSRMSEEQILEGRSLILRATLFYNYLSMLTFKHVWFALKCLAASVFEPKRVLTALDKALKEGRFEYLVYALVFNYVKRYKPRSS